MNNLIILDETLSYLNEEAFNSQLYYIYNQMQKILNKNNILNRDLKVYFANGYYYNLPKKKEYKDYEVFGVIYSVKEDSKKYITMLKSVIVKSKIFGSHLVCGELVKDEYFFYNIVLYIKNPDGFKSKFDKEEINKKIKDFADIFNETFDPVFKKIKDDNDLYYKFYKLVKAEKFDKAKDIIDSIADQRTKENYQKTYDSHLKEYNDKVSKSKPIIDNNGKEILKFNNRFGLYICSSKYKSYEVYVEDSDDVRTEKFINSFNFDEDFKVFDKALSKNYKDLCLELCESYFEELESFYSKDEITKKYGTPESAVSKCKLDTITYRPIENQIIFDINISLLSDYSGVANCYCITSGKDSGKMGISDIYCD